MSGTGIKFQGISLARGDGATPTEVFTKIGQITTLTAPDKSVKAIDVTSADDSAMRYIAGIVNSGDVSFDMILDSNLPQHKGLDADLEAGTKRNFKLTLPDTTATLTTATLFAFTAIVTKFSIKGQVDDKLTASVTLKVDGEITTTWLST